MSQKTKTIEGVNVFGETRLYRFNLMNAETGTEIFSKFASIIGVSFEKMKPILEKFTGLKFEDDEAIKEKIETDLTYVDMFSILPQVFNWETIKDLSETMLAGCQVDIDGTTVEVPGSGICPFAEGDPLEQYTALFYAVCANYPKYVSFFGVAVEDSGRVKNTEESQAASAQSTTH